MKTKELKDKYERIKHHFDEKSKRLWCANEAIEMGWGGVSAVSKATGVSRTTINAGIKEIAKKAESPINRIRRTGGGRKKKSENNKELITDLDSLIEPITRGDPESPLRWVCKSTRKLAAELNNQGHNVSHSLVARILAELDYSLQSNKKTIEGSEDHPDRDAQFQFINDKVKKFQHKNLPVISVDTKKKENIGNYKNNGREYRKKKNPVEVGVYDFIGKLGKVAPYGVYDITKNKGWVSVGLSHDTAEFAVNSIRNWWLNMGQIEYPAAKELFITADGGGSNGYRVRLWKTELQKLANELDIKIHVSHFPPGTSKWNKIEHRMFSFISQNWRGKPLIDYVTVVSLISSTRTDAGLEIRAIIDEHVYEKGRKVTDEELASVNIFKYKFHGEWNYRISKQN